MTALIERVKGARNIVAKKSSALLMISQPNTPDLPPIPETKREVEVIRQQLSGNKLPFSCLEENAATLESVTMDIESHSCIHLACHAVQNPGEPLKSGFHLYDGKLELSEILKKNLPNAGFAFLSACQTSTGDEKLSEEAVHLGAGMLAAGYQGVVATMWSIKDAYGPIVAENFYSQLLVRGAAEGGGGLNSAGAAHVLHYAIQSLRQRVGDSEDALLSWVPYVHFGL